MKTVWNWIQAALAVVGGGLGWFFGEMDGFFYALIAFVVIDYPFSLLEMNIQTNLVIKILSEISTVCQFEFLS